MLNKNTKISRNAKKYLLLKAIQEGQKHTLANAALAPLCASGYIDIVEYKPNGYSAKRCKLTAWGVTWLQFEDKKQNGKI